MQVGEGGSPPLRRPCADAPPAGIWSKRKDRPLRKLAMILAICAAPAGAAQVAVPSGHVMELFDVIMEPELGRFRFALPAVADGVRFADLVDDLDYLCAQVAQPALVAAGADISEIVISVSAAQVPFGEPTEVVQYFQPYRLIDGKCEWDAF